jgi:hypothetical protein
MCILAVNDIFVCCLPLQFYGGAAQDFGTARPLWESYGWSLFKLQDPPAAANLDDVKIQVRNSINRLFPTLLAGASCVFPLFANHQLLLHCAIPWWQGICLKD